jgi:hypothetical protein
MKPTKRVDPKSRPPSGRRPWDHVENRDPNRHYCFANPNSQDTGVDYYLSIGYEVVKYSVDGPRPKVFRTLKEGDAVTCMGQILMSIPLDEKQSMDAEMMANVDAIERKMIRSGGIADSMRGSAGQAKFVPDTSESFAE